MDALSHVPRMIREINTRYKGKSRGSIPANQAVTALIALSMLSGACSKQNDLICPVAPPSVEQSSKEPYTAEGWDNRLSACVERWSLRLARSDGDIRDVGEAVLGACNLALTSAVSSQAAEDRKNQIAGPSYDDAMKERERSSLRMAMFYIASGRAGKCNLPK